MSETRLSTCMLCEAACGIRVEVEGGKVARVTGDRDDPFSRGYICPKAAALDDVRTDPDRVLSPMVRSEDGKLARATWDAALDRAAGEIARVQREHGKDAVALYLGNPMAHNYAGLLYAGLFWFSLGTRSRFSATSADQLPHMLASLEMFGNQAMLPMPDIDRTDLMIILGANPVVSNGSLMTAPGVKARLQAIQARGGRVVVIDPRRTETADLADAHHFIRPGTDALLLLAMLHVVFEEKRARLGRLAGFATGVEALERASKPYAPERVADATGIAPEVVRALARDLCATERAVVYGRVGLCTQEAGGLATWLVVALNAVTGHLDSEGGMMFSSPAIDLVALAARIGLKGSFATYRSKVRGLPEFGGELPVAALAEEIEAGNIRALVTLAGNPVLSTPNGARLERALPKLESMVCLDIYANETTRHATTLLPTSFGLEREHYDLVLNVLAVRNTARWAPAVFAPAGETRHDWWILSELTRRIGARRGGFGGLGVTAAGMALGALGPKRWLDLLLRTGPRKLSLRDLEKSPHGIDLGAHVRRLPEMLYTPEKRLHLAPRLYLEALPGLEKKLQSATNGLVLIGRRQLRSNNSWMHNSVRLVKGGDRCTLLMHPEDAKARGLSTGARVCVSSRVGEVTAPLEVSDEIARGVVSLPHGWGHREEARLEIARAHAGASVNDLTDETHLDALSATAGFSGVPVEVRAAT
jgi:anaerobic selenocysteine-containing dehydrogenase